MRGFLYAVALLLAITPVAVIAFIVLILTHGGGWVMLAGVAAAIGALAWLIVATLYLLAKRLVQINVP